MERNEHAELSPQAATAALLLANMELDCEPDILAQLMGVPAVEAETALKELEAEGMAICGASGWARAQGRVPTPESLLKLCGKELAPESLAQALSKYYQGDRTGFFRQSLASLQCFTEKNHALAARMAYDIIIGTFLKMKVPLSNRSLCAKFVRYGMDIQMEMPHFPWNVSRRALSFYYKMRGIAFFWGDRRSLAHIDLGIGYTQINLRSPKKAAFYQQVMSRGVAAIEELGDSDILLRSASMLCFYYFVEGNYPKAINSAYSSLYLPDFARYGNFDRSLYSHATLSAIHLGEFDIAANILILSIDKAERRGRASDACTLRAFLPYVRLAQGKEKEALEMIDSLIDTRNSSALTYTDLWASRTLAYHHYLKGDILSSYTCFKSWLQKTHALGFTHANYISAPFVLELLAAYYLAGFPPPQHNTLQEELTLAMASPSCLIRGTALRLAGAVRAREWGWGDGMALEYLQKSLDLFRTFSAPIERAHTLIALARLHQAKGEEERALALAAEAWSIHKRYGQPAWPPELNRLLDNRHKREQAPPALTPMDFCTRLFQTIREQYAWESDEAFFSSLLYAVLAAFGAARGGIFRVDAGSGKGACAQPPFALSRANLPDNILETPNFQVARSMVEESSGGKRTAYLRQARLAEPAGGRDNAADSAGCTTLLMPVDAEKQGLYLVYLEGSLPPPVAQVLGEELFTLLSGYLATEISIHLRRGESWQSKVRSLSAHAPRLAEAGPILFRTGSMRDLMAQVDRLAEKNATVLILGESGVGKELIARRLHELSGVSGEFVGVNLASTPDELFESEFYGHEKGSFTGAHYQKRGLFELADKGTLFIDEVGDIPHRLQVKLLRVLQERQFMRVGGTRLLSSDFRLIAATNRNLEQDVREGRFREDLYYRLSVVPLHVPPLRDRPEDIPHLAEHFLRDFAQRHQSPVQGFTEEDHRRLLAHPWPGNVRELKNYVERFVLTSDKERHTHLNLVPGFGPGVASSGPAARLEAGGEQNAALHPESLAPVSGNPADLAALPSLEEMQSRYFEYVYQRANGVIGGSLGVATILGISRTTAYALIDKLKLKDKYARRLMPK